jgi:hypothetical protein
MSTNVCDLYKFVFDAIKSILGTHNLFRMVQQLTYNINIITHGPVASGYSMFQLIRPKSHGSNCFRLLLFIVRRQGCHM